MIKAGNFIGSGECMLYKGKIEKAREDIIVVLEERFGTIDSSIEEKLAAKEDLELLTSLHRKSVKVASIEEFKKLL